MLIFLEPCLMICAVIWCHLPLATAYVSFKITFALKLPGRLHRGCLVINYQQRVMKLKRVSSLKHLQLKQPEQQVVD
jgi:hypothetical protein